MMGTQYVDSTRFDERSISPKKALGINSPARVIPSVQLKGLENLDLDADIKIVPSRWEASGWRYVKVDPKRN